MNQEEFESMVATLEQENRQLRARNERLEDEKLKELSAEEMNEIIQFLNQSRISWSGNEFIKEAMRLAIKKASEK